MSLSLRRTLPLLLFFVPATLGLTSFQLVRARAGEDARLDAARALRRHLGEAQHHVGRALRAGDADRAAEEVVELALYDDVTWAALVDPDGRVAASTRLDWVGHPADGVLPALPGRGASPASTRPEVGDDGGVGVWGQVSVPGRAGPGLVPPPRLTLVVALDIRGAVAARVHDGSRVAAAVGAAGAGLGLLIWGWLHLQITGRLERILAAIRALQAGDRAARTAVNGADELGRIGAAVDALADALGRAEVARDEARRRAEDAFESDGDPLLIVDAELRLVQLNHAARALLERPGEPLLGAALGQLLDLGGEAADDSGPSLRVRGRGPWAPLELDLSLRELRAGLRLVRLRDRSAPQELEQLRERLRSNDRLAALGAIAAGVGHEIATPVTAILGNLEHLREAVIPQVPEAPRAELADVVEELVDGAHRISAVLADLRAFGRQQSPSAPLPFSPLPAVRSALGLVRPALRARAQVEEQLGPAPMVLGDARKLGQVVMNLAINASHAVTGRPGGQLRVSLRVDPAADPARPVLIEVADNGPGVPVELRARIFDPFFTTKPAEEGTGLGLAICREIVDQMGGSLELSDTPGGGATFSVRLPVATPGA
jgi:signal transduction histidine kinase